MYDLTILGAGVSGAAIAWQAARYQLSVCVLEKENDIACGTTKANSAIIHAGYDPMPGTLMAKLNVRGNAMVEEMSEKLDFPFKKVGSLILAFNDDNLRMVHELYERGVKNGVPGLQILSPQEVWEREPAVTRDCVGALYAPSAGIVMPWRMAQSMADCAALNGVEFRLNAEVTGVSRGEEGITLTLQNGETVQSRYVVNATGVDAWHIRSLIAPPPYTMKPSRGEYFLLDKAVGDTVHTVIFQCPTEVGKGVLVSPTADGNLIVGPNAEPVSSSQETGTTAEGLAFVQRMARLSVPSVSFRDNIRNFAGVRANTNIDDFIIEEVPELPGFIDCAGIKSPGLSSAPAIGEYVMELLGKAGLPLTERETFIDSLPHRVRVRELSPAQRAEVIAKNPLYGRVICRCETITEGEIVDALHSPIPPCSIDGVKRRCGAGMGRCQGGFCGPRVHEIIARELGIPMQQIPQDRKGMYIITGETKTEG